MNNPVEAKIWRTIGAIPTPMNFGEVYQSLQSGVLEGLLHVMMIPLLLVIILCAPAPWTVLALPRLLVPRWL